MPIPATTRQLAFLLAFAFAGCGRPTAAVAKEPTDTTHGATQPFASETHLGDNKPTGGMVSFPRTFHPLTIRLLRDPPEVMRLLKETHGRYEAAKQLEEAPHLLTPPQVLTRQSEAHAREQLQLVGAMLGPALQPGFPFAVEVAEAIDATVGMRISIAFLHQLSASPKSTPWVRLRARVVMQTLLLRLPSVIWSSNYRFPAREVCSLVRLSWTPWTSTLSAGGYLAEMRRLSSVMQSFTEGMARAIR